MVRTRANLCCAENPRCGDDWRPRPHLGFYSPQRFNAKTSTPQDLGSPRAISVPSWRLRCLWVPRSTRPLIVLLPRFRYRQIPASPFLTFRSRGMRAGGRSASSHTALVGRLVTGATASTFLGFRPVPRATRWCRTRHPGSAFNPSSNSLTDSQFDSPLRIFAMFLVFLITLLFGLGGAFPG